MSSRLQSEFQFSSMPPPYLQRNCLHATLTRLECVYQVRQKGYRKKPVDCCTPYRRWQETNTSHWEMGRPLPSSVGYQLKSKPFTIIMCRTTTLATNFSLTQEFKSSSAFPVSSQECCRQKSEPLVAAIMIDTIGTKTIPLDLGFFKFKWSFMLANVNYPMLDANFSAASISSLTSTPVTSLTLKHENVRWM